MVKEVLGSMERKHVMERLLEVGDGKMDVEGATFRSENKIDPMNQKPANKQNTCIIIFFSLPWIEKLKGGLQQHTIYPLIPS